MWERGGEVEACSPAAHPPTPAVAGSSLPPQDLAGAQDVSRTGEKEEEG